MFNKIYEKIKKFIIENYIFLIVIVVMFFVFTIKLPFVVYTPGGYIDLNDRIEIEDTTDIDGSYNMAYVSMFYGTIPAILLSYIIPDWDLVSEKEITLDNQSIEELILLDKIQMEAARDTATILAYQKAGKEISVTKEVLNVVYLDPNAETDLKIGDEIISVNDVEVFSVEDVADVLKDISYEEKIIINVLRDGKELETSSIVKNMDDTPKIGVVFINTYEYDENPISEIDFKSSESGPSGGLMLTLAIYDKLVNDNLSNGKTVVGTGTISLDGTVGEIDGVKYKLLGSKDADIFLCPKENYDEAINVKEEYDLDMDIYSVNTFDEAVDILLD